LLGPGEIAAWVRMLPKWRSSLDHYAHRDTVLVHLPADALRAVADSEPILWRDIAELMLERFVDNVGALRDVALSPLGQRVAATLVDMGRVNGVQEVSGLGLRLSQDELGALLGVSRQSINKELRGLEAAGVIGADYNRITIRDLRALTALIAANA
jgi:CRP-like cAMP-binding protein